MSKKKDNKASNSTKSKQLFSPIDEKDQEIISGGWSRRSRGGGYW